MPSSYDQGKQSIIKWIKENFNFNDKILDVGPGKGTYSNYLNPVGYKNIDCIEIYEPYIETYDLKNKYKNVFIGNIMDFETSSYNLIIFGDVLEHLNAEDANKILKKIIDNKKTKGIIISVPFMYEQGSYGGNVYETHHQPDLNKEVMEKRYPYLNCLKIEGRIGVYYWLRS
jgi:SAM-dependent methyltransferase